MSKTELGETSNASVTVVIPTFERPDRIRGAIESVIAQTLQPVEIIVVDDNGAGTKDQQETQRNVEAIPNTINLKYVPLEKNRGNASARNVAMVMAKGDYIAFLDDDDRWHPENLQTQISYLQRDPECGLSFCMTTQVSDDQKTYARPTQSPTTMNAFEGLLRGNFITTFSGCVIRRSVLMRVGLLDDDMLTREDHDFFLRLAREHKITCVDRPLVFFTIHDSRISRKPTKKVTGWMRFLNKWQYEYRQRPDAFKAICSYRDFEMAKIFHILKRYHTSQLYARRALSARPYHWRSYVLWIASLLHLDIGLK